jgi:N-acetylmuramoyl-L-alanine amidase
MPWTKFLSAVCLVFSALLAGQTAQRRTPPAQAPAMPSIPVPAPPPQVAPRFLVLLDAAHGGSDTGARLTATLLEKDLTLDLANRLRSLLSARGIDVTMTRTSDLAMPADSRAEIADHTPFAACIIIHATTTGSGVHLYTSSLAPTSLTMFMPWQSAQSAYVTQSLKLSSDIDAALTHAEIPVTLGQTALQPMDSFTCPAVAVEIAPLLAGSATKGQPITDAKYQRTLLDVLTAAIEEWRNDWRQQP